MKKRGQDWDEFEEGGHWKFNSIGCLLCGKVLTGRNYGEAHEQYVNHHRRNHEGEYVSYVPIGEPIDADAKKQAKKVGTFAEALKIEEIRRDHGDGWYMFALREGINKALELIPHEEELAARAQKIMAEGRPATGVGPRGREVERKEKGMEWTQQ